MQQNFNRKPSRGEITLKVDLDVSILHWISEKYCVTVWTSTNWLRIWSNWDVYEHGVEPSEVHTNKEFSGHLSNFNKRPAPRNYLTQHHQITQPQTNPEMHLRLTLQVKSQASTGRNGGRCGVGVESLRTVLSVGEPLAWGGCWVFQLGRVTTRRTCWCCTSAMTLPTIQAAGRNHFILNPQLNY